MAPIRFKNSPASAQTLARPAAQDARILVRETMRVTAAATLASAPPLSTPPLTTLPEKVRDAELRFLPGRELGLLGKPDALRVVCLEEVDGKKWKYVAVEEGSGKLRMGTSVKAISLQHSPMAPVDVSLLDGAPCSLSISSLLSNFVRSLCSMAEPLCILSQFSDSSGPEKLLLFKLDLIFGGLPTSAISLLLWIGHPFPISWFASIINPVGDSFLSSPSGFSSSCITRLTIKMHNNEFSCHSHVFNAHTLSYLIIHS